MYKRAHLLLDLFTVSDLTSRLPISRPTVTKMVDEGILPEPDVRVGKRKYYSRELLEKIVSRFDSSKSQ